jgi:DNA-directed RNA polymerase subunit RPC12/RpoP
MAARSKMRLHPFAECVRDAFPLMIKGAKIYQQFNCAKCGAKQTMDEANKFFETGRCEECGHITDIKHDGCNYAVHFQRPT